MHRGKSAILILAGIAATQFLAGCSSDKPGNGSRTDTAGGLTWNAPSSWQDGPAQQMRVKTYIVKASEGDAENAECGVFYFAGGFGGGKEANLHRWTGQFEQPDGRNSADLAVIREIENNGLKITTIELDGIYKLSAGPMMEVKERIPGFRLYGAIVEGPQGSVFFKMVGPEKTVSAAESEFMNMLKSARAGAK